MEGKVELEEIELVEIEMGRAVVCRWKIEVDNGGKERDTDEQ